MKTAGGMSIQVSYMGTKRALAPEVGALCRSLKSGAFLDLFSGMCAVGNSIGANRPIWSNDFQVFATTVAEANFCLIDPPLETIAAVDMLKEYFIRNKEYLLLNMESSVEEEDCALKFGNVAVLQSIFERSIAAAQELNSESALYDVFTTRFSATYFSSLQCIQIDSLIFAIDSAFEKANPQRQWLKVALAVAMARCTTSTGHFAQPLLPNDGNIRKIIGSYIRV